MASDLTFTPAQRALAAALNGPSGLLRKFAGPPRVNDEGWQLDLATQVFCRLSELAPRAEFTPSGALKVRAESNRFMPIGMPSRSDVLASQRSIPGPGGDIPVRVYRRPSGEPQPAIVYFHGGGWVVGNLDTHDATCRNLAVEAGCVVIAVDYRMAPEHPFPAAPDDCIAAYLWVHEHAESLEIDTARIGVMGDSAGGNLSAVVALQIRDRKLPAAKLQCLVYPSTDMTFSAKSHSLFGEGFVLTRDSMEFFRALYAPDPDTWGDVRLAPSRAKNFADLAPALIYTAGFDPLRDEGRDYAETLRNAGVSAKYRCYNDRIHGFFGMGIFPATMPIINEICHEVGAALRE